MKLRIKEMIFNNIHIFTPQIRIDSIKEGYKLNNKYYVDLNDESWGNIENVALQTFEEAKKLCDETHEIELERRIIIHDLPEK